MAKYWNDLVDFIRYVSDLSKFKKTFIAVLIDFTQC